MRLLSVVLTSLLLAGVALPAGAADAPPGAPDVPPAEAAAIRQVIQTQLDAFRRDDATGAFAEAAPSIRALFGDDPATFLDMVRRAYQPVYHPRRTSFGAAVLQDGKIVQKLETIDAEGGAHEALYFMEHEPDGSWRISGCVLTDSGSVGA